ELDADGSPIVDSGELANTVTASSNEAPDVSTSLSIPIVQTPALTLVKSASPLSYDHVGELVTYSYEVTNSGNVTLTGPVTVTDDRARVPGPAVVPLAPGDPPVICSATYSVTQADLDAGSVVNTAFATMGPVDSPPDTVEVDAATSALLSIVKSSPTTL